MISRILACMLACLIGIPMCWCCGTAASAQVSAKATEEVLCCHVADAGENDHGHSSPSSEDDCPCVLKTGGRDKVAHEVVLPTVDHGWGHALPEPIMLDEAWKPWLTEAEVLRRDKIPRGFAAEAQWSYQRQCKWLL